MPRSYTHGDATTAIVYRYGTPSRIQLPPVVWDQLRLAHQLRNALVEISIEADEARAAVYAQFPGVAAATTALEQATAEVTREFEILAEARKVQRTRSPKIPGAAQRRQDAQARVRECRAALKAAKDEEKVHAKPLLEDVAARQRASVKALYHEYRTQGLYWAVINDVVDHHNVAERRLIELRSAGRPAARRFRRFTGAGALAVQLQRQADMPARDPALLASGQGPWRNVLQFGNWMPPDDFQSLPPAQRREQARSTITMRVGDEHVQIPAVLHRMLPARADVTGARLVVSRVGADHRVSVNLTAKIPQAAPCPNGPTIAVHGGWRREADDAIRVATWRSTQPLDVPSSLADVVRTDTPTTGIVVLPASWRAGLARPDEIRSTRDKLLEPMRTQLVEWLRTEPQADGPTATQVSLWRSPNRFAALALRWREDPPPGGEDICAALETWRAADKKLWQRQEHGRGKHLGRRKDAWCRVAAWLTRVAGRIVVDDTDLAGLIRTLTAETRRDPVPDEVTKVPARQRVDAAPGDFRASVVATATREGVPVDTVTSVNLTREHTCGHVLDAEPTTRPILCRGCSRYYDPDASATMLMLLRADSTT